MNEKNTTNGILGQRIKELRKARGWTLDEFVQRVGISKSAAGYYENDGRMPDAAILTRIADAFNVSTDYLLGRTNTAAVKGKMKTVCEMTGLSDSTVDYLSQLVKNRDFAKLSVINHLFDEASDDYDYYNYRLNGGTEVASAVLNAIFLYFDSLFERKKTVWEEFVELSDPSRREMFETAYRQYLFNQVVDAVKESGKTYKSNNVER